MEIIQRMKFARKHWLPPLPLPCLEPVFFYHQPVSIPHCTIPRRCLCCMEKREIICNRQLNTVIVILHSKGAGGRKEQSNGNSKAKLINAYSIVTSPYAFVMTTYFFPFKVFKDLVESAKVQMKSPLLCSSLLGPSNPNPKFFSQIFNMASVASSIAAESPKWIANKRTERPRFWPQGI